MAHFDSTIHPLAYAVTIERIDGTTLGLTSLNHDFVINGVTYLSNSAIASSAVSQKTNLSTDNIDIKALVTNDVITAEDLLSGLYDNAAVTCSLVDFTNLPTLITAAITLLTGRVGEVNVSEVSFSFEIRSLSELLNRALNHKTSPICPYVFGDFRCTKNLAGSGLFFTGLVISNALGADLTIGVILSDDFIGGTIQFTTGNNDGKLYEIAAIAGSTITLVTSPSLLVVPGDLFNATAFCAKTITACQDYANEINFGGVKVGGNWVPGLSRITTVP